MEMWCCVGGRVKLRNSALSTGFVKEIGELVQSEFGEKYPI